MPDDVAARAGGIAAPGAFGAVPPAQAASASPAAGPFGSQHSTPAWGQAPAFGQPPGGFGAQAQGGPGGAGGPFGSPQPPAFGMPAPGSLTFGAQAGVGNAFTMGSAEQQQQQQQAQQQGQLARRKVKVKRKPGR